MAKEQLIWMYNKSAKCFEAECDGIEYFIQTNIWNDRLIYKLYVIEDGVQNHVTGGYVECKLQKVAEKDLVRRQI